MSRALVILDSRFQRQKAADWCWALKEGTRVEFKAPKRSDDQNAKMWVLLSEVASQVDHMGKRYTPDEWKILFMHACGREVKFLPGLDGKTFVPWGQSSSDLSKQEMSDLIEFIHAWGAEHGVAFNEPASDHPPSKPGSETAGSASDNPTSPGLSDDATEPAEPVEAGAEGQEQSEPALASDDFTAADLDWIHQSARMIWAATEKGYQETVDNQVIAIKKETPDRISQAAREKLGAIRKQCKLVCFGELAHAEGRKIVAALSGVSEDELREVEP